MEEGKKCLMNIKKVQRLVKKLKRMTFGCEVLMMNYFWALLVVKPKQHKGTKVAALKVTLALRRLLQIMGCSQIQLRGGVRKILES